ncbi:MAG: hypothetical protein AVDCRST_MAG49-3678 [uncultured Thermomicrobiales bacterium]|uniref:Major facilitator superfamily (MFS) profile domain-containing protein n=1 Tax=uncultured Thermomicrobiales bacterium TaxID=1645740 RepID=A0A6J4V7N4_9BACT|nr:MAG: hypothetical protein AVDCRST_MAG49-3678 [uncultured Thermomicrobiales bacterium]
MTARLRLTGLWLHDDFRRLWVGQTVSVFGSYISGFAIPLVAVLTLDASPLQVALLGAAGLAPGLVVAPVAGVWTDRLRRRPVLIVTDVARAAVLVTIPLAAALDALRVEHLLVVALLTSALSVTFDVAYRAYLPSLVRREDLVEGNSKLQASASVAEVAGFGLAGLLVQALTAPVAILLDVGSFLASAAALSRIRTPEPHPTPSVDGANPAPGVWREARDGWRAVFRDPVLRALTATTGTWEFFRGMVGAVIILFVGRELDIAPALIGVLFGLGGASALAGALVANRASRRWGFGRVLVGSLLVAGAAILFLPLAAGPLAVVLPLLAAQQLAGDGAATVYEIGRTTLLQASAPPAIQGRVNATARVVEWTATLGGLVVGGLVGDALGPRAVLVLAGLGCLLAPLWLLRSPIPSMREALPAHGAG